MNLLIMRHGEAVVVSNTDEERQLTASGRQSVSHCAEQIAAKGLRVEQLLVSPYLRTQQTAEIVVGQLGITNRIRLVDTIVPDGDPIEVVNLITTELRRLSAEQTLMVVTHQPLIGQLVWHLSGVRAMMGTSSLAVIDFDTEGRTGELLCII